MGGSASRSRSASRSEAIDAIPVCASRKGKEIEKEEAKKNPWIKEVDPTAVDRPGVKEGRYEAFFYVNTVTGEKTRHKPDDYDDYCGHSGVEHKLGGGLSAVRK